MFEDLKYITLSGEEYPVKCDLVVLEKLQDEFGSVDEFEEKIFPWEPKLDEKGSIMKGEDGKIMCRGRIPDIKAVNAALEYMVNEGEEILAEKEKRAPKTVSREKLARRVDIAPGKLADQLYDEFKRCFYIKNGKTTQNQTESGENS